MRTGRGAQPDPQGAEPLPVRPVTARPFGISAADLEIDFAAADRAEAVTNLLALLLDDTGEPVPADEIWDWTLRLRLQALLAVRLASLDASAALGVKCRSCEEGMEVDLDLMELVSPSVDPRFVRFSIEDQDVVVRLPRGRDQQLWIRNGTRDPTRILAGLVESIGGRPTEPSFLPPQAWHDPAGNALEAYDPLTALVLRTRCPICGDENVVDLDLELFLLRELAGIQDRLIEDVARLATAFHWRETDILALPSWRRNRYLRMLEAGGVS